ncbi:nicotinate-nucleotide pyrophosphorylase [carboxylating]-like isoform X2 [Brachionichthys hirsutus]|uniref:nicotinate-nucleotide pyrophosphorylase [carboxylating]-like isoform X2 n=1 Tax=Brachionichthys hirsutus TaxID=412623 RepID=UPI0036043BD3
MSPGSYTAAHLIPPHSLTRLARQWLEEDTPNFDPAGPEAITVTAVVKGPARCLLLGERPALNCLARASGIATRCSQLQAMRKAAAWHGELAGTRKTTPGFRLVEKYAMLVGGVSMHRQDLSGMVMLKDNHIWASGSITQAVEAARSMCGFSSKIEVECQSLHEAREAAGAGADIVMLDNLQPQDLHIAAQAFKEEFPALLVEASGGVTPENLALYCSAHVDIISLGCITQGCPVVDFSLKIQKPAVQCRI